MKIDRDQPKVPDNVKKALVMMEDLNVTLPEAVTLAEAVETGQRMVVGKNNIPHINPGDFDPSVEPIIYEE